MSSVRTKKERFLPYRYDKLGVQLDFTSVELDGTERSDLVDRETHRILLDRSWSTGILHCSAEMAASVLRSVIPQAEETPVALVLAMRCPETRLRQRVFLDQAAPNPEKPDVRRFAGRIALERDLLAGNLEIEPFVVRTAPLANPSSGYAAHEGARVAGGRSWDVHLDRRHVPEGRFLDVRMKSFKADPLTAEENRANLYVLDADQAVPTLWLNSDHGRLAGVLASEGTQGASARIRDVAFDQLSFPVWSQLLLRAIHHRFDEGEAVYEWEEGAIETLTTWMYPDVPTHTERLRRLEYEHQDLPMVLKRLDQALQRESELVGHLLALIEEVAR